MKILNDFKNQVQLIDLSVWCEGRTGDMVGLGGVSEKRGRRPSRGDVWSAFDIDSKQF